MSMKRIPAPNLIALALALVLILFIAAPAPALIMIKKGNDPVSDMGWPAGALALANLKSRLLMWEGPPFGGGQSNFVYRGDTDALNEALKLFGAVRAPVLQLVIHEGPQDSPFLKDDKDPKADTRYDWSFTVWNPESWHRLFNDPRTTFMSRAENFRNPVDPPRFDVYVTAKIDWTKVKVPANVRVEDQRKPGGAKLGDGATVAGDVFDMATGKPIAGAKVSVETAVDNGEKWEDVASNTADADGRFEVSKIPAGNYTIVVTADGYAPRTVGYELLKDGNARKLVVELVTAAKLTGTVTDTNNKPLPNVKVRADSMAIDGRGYAPRAASEATTDAQGRFTLADLPRGYAVLFAHAEGLHQVDNMMKILSVGERFTRNAEPLVIRMAGTGTVRGRVTNAVGGPPAADTHVHIGVPNEKVGDWGGATQIKPDGTFEFENVPPATYFVSTDPLLPGVRHAPGTIEEITVTAGKTTDVTLTTK
jgi:uncharacterized GH25 family protein